MDIPLDETFTLLPLTIDPQSKAITATHPQTLSDASLPSALTALNNLHRALISLPSDTHQTPPPPTTTNPKRSAQIQKMRDQGNASLKKTTTSSSSSTNTAASEAIKLYTYALDMALGRPSWEPAALVREECAVLFANRAQAHMAAGLWAEGAVDAETSVQLKRVGNGKAWWRRGRCLCEMGRWEEAGEWVREGLEVEGNEGELGGLGREIEERGNKGVGG